MHVLLHRIVSQRAFAALMFALILIAIAPPSLAAGTLIAEERISDHRTLEELQAEYAASSPVMDLEDDDEFVVDTAPSSIYDEPLLAVYLTLPEIDTSRHVTVHFITRQKLEHAAVEFGDSSMWNLTEIAAEARTLSGVPRWYYSARLSNLTPNSIYYFRIAGFRHEFKFRSLPDDNTPIRVIQGGDMGYNPDFADISREAMKREPHVIFLGGDLSYANGEKKNLSRWDGWWQGMNEVMTTPEGFLVPLIVAVGNHEVSLKRIGKKEKRAPFFFAQFPPPGDRTYHKKKLGAHTVLFVMDTGHIAPHIGPQVSWLKRNMKKERDTINKIALYHIPLYPSHRRYRNPMSAMLRMAWRPIFDKYGLDMAFENHDHSLKRTHLLRKNKIVKKAAPCYLGDGCWGKNPRKTEPRSYLAHSQSIEHVWYAELGPKEMRFEAIGIDGHVIDKATLQKD